MDAAGGRRNSLRKQRGTGIYRNLRKAWRNARCNRKHKEITDCGGKYDFIIKDLFDLDYNIETSCINYCIQDRKREFNLYKVFLDTFAAEIGNDLRKVELIEALLFLSMIPLHGESIRHQMVMLGTGLEILNRVVNIQVEGEE